MEIDWLIAEFKFSWCVPKWWFNANNEISVDTQANGRGRNMLLRAIHWRTEVVFVRTYEGDCIGAIIILLLLWLRHSSASISFPTLSSAVTRKLQLKLVWIIAFCDDFSEPMTVDFGKYVQQDCKINNFAMWVVQSKLKVTELFQHSSRAILSHLLRKVKGGKNLPEIVERDVTCFSFEIYAKKMPLPSIVLMS